MAVGPTEDSYGAPAYSSFGPTHSVTSRVPHKCPVCSGRGTVPCGFYSSDLCSSTVPEMCQSCHGAGILWSET